MTRPLCRYCGKPIPKRTSYAFFVDEISDYQRNETWCQYVVGRPTTREEAQRLVNGTIVSVKKGAGDKAGTISAAGVWHGGYTDPFFCNGEHAKRYAYAVATYNPELGTAAYTNAKEAQK